MLRVPEIRVMINIERILSATRRKTHAKRTLRATRRKTHAENIVGRKLHIY